MRFFLMVMVLVLAGCATVTGNRNLENNYTQIQKGDSTISDVVALLGNPHQVVHRDGKYTIMIYEKRKSRAQYGFFGTRKTDIERLTVFFNTDDVVTDYKMEHWTDDSVGQEGVGDYNTF